MVERLRSVLRRLVLAGRVAAERRRGVLRRRTPPAPGHPTLNDINQHLEAVFLFDGAGLYITGDALDKSAQFDADGTRVTLTLPNHDEVFSLADPRWPGAGKAARPTSQSADGEMLAGTVLKFEVRVAVAGTADDATSELVAGVFPLALATAERFLGLARTRAAQDWLPSRHEGANVALYGRLVYAGTDTEVKEQARWQPTGLAVGIQPELAAGPDEIEQLLSLTSAGVEPMDEDVLLADARAALSVVRVRQQWKAERRDTGRAVLLAGMAAEVKIKRTLTEKVRPEQRPLLEVILENPRDMSIATSQLLDKPMKAALGISLREEKPNLPDQYKTLFNDVAQKLFPRRNAVAHRGEQPTLDEARETVEIAGRLFAWLDTVPGA
jgi:hypothetical protein